MLAPLVKCLMHLKKKSIALGIAPSVEKSHIYFSGIQDDVATNLANIVQMPISELPFKFLGVTMTSKKLTYAQSKPLVEKITSRAQSWMAILLSNASTLQLVRSVLSSIQNFWAHIFPLSNKLIKAMESECRRFLWLGTLEKGRKAHVA